MDPTFNPSSWQHWALILSLVIFVAIGYSQAAAEDRRLRLLRQARATGQPSPQVNPPRRAAPPAQASRRPSSPGWLALNRYLPAPKRQRPEMDYIPERDDRAYGDSDPAYRETYSTQNYSQPIANQPGYSPPAYSPPAYNPPVPEQPQPVIPRGNPFPDPVGTPFPAPATQPAKASKAKASKAKASKSKALQASQPIDDIPSTPTEIVYDSTPVSRSAAPPPEPPYRPLVTKAPRGGSPFLDIPKDRWPL